MLTLILNFLTYNILFRNASVYSLESDKKINKSAFAGDEAEADISSRFEVSNIIITSCPSVISWGEKLFFRFLTKPISISNPRPL